MDHACALFRLLPAMLTLTFAGGCWKQEVQSTPTAGTIARTEINDWFKVAQATGLEFTYRNGEESHEYGILETVGGGVGLLDFDQDGRLDCFLAGGGSYSQSQGIAGKPTGAFRQMENGGWSSIGSQAMRGDSLTYTHGIAAADFNSDGFPDLLVTGYGGLQLWVNAGDGTFSESAEPLGLTDKLWSTSAAWFDLNGDGFLDLYICHYLDWSFDNNPICRSPRGNERDICTPHDFASQPDTLYLNSGDGAFRDASREVGLRSDGKGLGVVAGDLDNDGDADLYVGNDAGANFLYLNEGGLLTEVGERSGTAFDDQGLINGTMGVDLGDYNNDGLFDLWAANYEHEPFGLYRNFGKGQFGHVSKATGVTALGGVYVGFGTLFADFDQDGDEDLIVANGHVLLHPSIAPRRQKPLLLRNDGGRFVHLREFPQQSYFQRDLEGRGLAAGDLDQDGDLDVVISHQNEPAALLTNQSNNNSWVQLRLIGVASNRDAIGTRVALHTSTGDLWRQVKGGGSYASQSPLHLHWGLPAGTIADRCTIYWPRGKRQSAAVELSAPAVVVEED